jgi:tRNA modification GTPase
VRLLAADTIAAIATPPGRGALAIVRVSGSATLALGAECVSPWPLKPRRATLASVRHPGSGEMIDQVVCVAYAAPESFTGDDTIEIYCHGGAVAPSLVLEAFVRAGARPAAPGEFTRRAVLQGKLELLQAEAIGDLIDAPTGFVHRAALAQIGGALSARIQSLRNALLDLEALLAYDIDFPEEDDGPVAATRITQAATSVQHELGELLATLPAARLGREGATVVLAGVPNSGKSSLFNMLLGEQRAIVTEHAGTTRDAIDALIEADPYPWRIVDTAGLRDTADPIERLGVEVSTRWLAVADVVLACGCTTQERAAAVTAIGGDSPASVVRVQTMSDRGLNGEDADVHVSALSGAGADTLRAAIRAAIERRHPPPRAATPLILRARHEAALRTADEELQQFLTAWNAGALPATVAAVHVRAALHALDELIGAVDVDDVLARVFERFCVGK